ncbi:peptidoglycan DD-metalloendopeptidase family protein [Photobacterium sp. WH77]|uniref:peptidoglycan DD-metalloendopeptidase family protein n=1 Tax=unclassified Photobacterium TaxID=2628852 RepID=UPI001EDBFC0E|nr:MULTISPECIES: peptidoglycan DD-metalloendopeptidase family protein [unclassified Photobacterium]MCG2837111.1 peptidoglycan DD-metalloendopeptidase family protein [Photobacterium sp. WH77]MCG2844739.1 peptidoglycan DD-metalloendopeptidase family protein [Photobacterium sp. WH80]
MRELFYSAICTLRASALGTGALLCLAFSASVSADGQNQLDGMKQEIARQQKQLSDKKQQLNDVQKTLKQQELAIARAAGNIHAAEQKVDGLIRSISQLEKEQQALLQRQIGQRELLKELLTSQYKMGKSSPLANLLGESDPARLDRMAIYASHLSQARSHALDELAATDTELQLKKHQLSEQRNEQQTLLSQLKKDRATLLGSQQARKSTVRELQGQLNADKRYLTELKSNESRLITEIAKARKAAEDAARQARVSMDGLGKYKGKLPWPVSGRIRHAYGSPLQGELRWKGMVIGQAVGSEVKAVHGGKVVFADWLRGYGLMVAVDHGQGDMTFYGYNQTVLKKVGDSVQRNEAIALVGDSGGQESPGLYFEIRRKGTPTNPQPWLTR